MSPVVLEGLYLAIVIDNGSVVRNVYHTVCPVQCAIISDRTWASDVTFKIEHSILALYLLSNQ